MESAILRSKKPFNKNYSYIIDEPHAVNGFYFYKLLIFLQWMFVRVESWNAILK